MRKFCGNTQYRPKLCGNCAFPQNFYARKLGNISVFYPIDIYLLKVRNTRTRSYMCSKLRSCSNVFNINFVHAIPIFHAVMQTTENPVIWHIMVGIYMFKVNNKNTRIRYEICSKLTIKAPEQRH